jgi:transposase InsO family protein
MTVFVKNYVAGCAICQQMKVNTHPSAPGLFPIKAQPNPLPFSQVTCDFITDLPACDGFDSLMVVVDHGSTKGVISIPCTKTIDATQTAQNYIDHVYRRFGLPNSFLSDRGPQFNSHVFKEMMRLLGVKTLRSTAYHPQTDGETERVNQELEIYFRIFCTNNPRTWKHLNPLMEFSHNQKTHSVTKQTPFYLMMGYEPKDIPLAFEKTNTPTAEFRLKTLKEARNEASAAHELARQKVAERSTRGFTPFEKGQKVWLDGRNLKIGYESRKLAPKREGPFEISEVMGPVTYRLILPNQWRVHPVFHASLLSPYRETDTHGPNFLQPPPDLIEGEEEYKVEVIIAHKKRGSGYQYLVKWVGYPPTENQWRSTKDLKGSSEILEEYRLNHNL